MSINDVSISNYFGQYVSISQYLRHQREMSRENEYIRIDNRIYK